VFATPGPANAAGRGLEGLPSSGGPVGGRGAVGDPADVPVTAPLLAPRHPLVRLRVDVWAIQARLWFATNLIATPFGPMACLVMGPDTGPPITEELAVLVEALQEAPPLEVLPGYYVAARDPIPRVPEDVMRAWPDRRVGCG
jgi:hypothetical protein